MLHKMLKEMVIVRNFTVFTSHSLNYFRYIRITICQIISEIIFTNTEIIFLTSASFDHKITN
jgi:hypothetical protein